MDSVGETSGGCNPMNIDYEIINAKLTIKTADLDDYADKFVSWGGPVKQYEWQKSLWQIVGYNITSKIVDIRRIDYVKALILLFEDEDVLLEQILSWINEKVCKVYYTSDDMWRRYVCCQGKINKC